MREKKSAAREQAELLVDRYLDWLFSLTEDAGWHGGSILGRWLDFQGDIPQGSGFMGFDRYEKELRYLTHTGHRTAEAVGIVDSLPQDQRRAVLSDRAYRGRTKVAIDPFVPEKPVEILWTTARVAGHLGISEDAYRKQVSRGYLAIERSLDLKEAA